MDHERPIIGYRFPPAKPRRNAVVRGIVMIGLALLVGVFVLFAAISVISAAGVALDRGRGDEDIRFVLEVLSGVFALCCGSILLAI